MTATEMTIVPRAPAALQAAPGELTIEQMVEQSLKIQQLMKQVLVRDEHYGVIPGTGGRDGKAAKPTLLKPGAEKLCLMFRLDPEYETITSTETQQLFAYMIRCVLFHIPTGQRIASGLGSCNSRETKYVRPAPKTCPGCGGAFLIAGKSEYEKDHAFKGGMLCYQKKGGCGAKYKPGDEAIEKQPTGIADPSDLANTILKMACKRALIAAVLNGTAASDCFTQDLEDLQEKADAYEPPKPRTSGATDVEHEGVDLTPDQLRKIHELRVKCGQGWETAEDDARTDWRKKLAVYRGVQFERCPAASKLSKNQASHLIARMMGVLKKQADNPPRPIPVDDVNQPAPPDDDVPPPVDEEDDARFRSAMAEPDTGEAARGEQQTAIKGLLKKLGWKWGFMRLWFVDRWPDLSGASTPDKLVGALTQKQADAAYLLLSAHGKPLYDNLLAEMRASGEVAT